MVPSQGKRQVTAELRLESNQIRMEQLVGSPLLAEVPELQQTGTSLASVGP